jgi:uncharacterized protein
MLKHLALITVLMCGFCTHALADIKKEFYDTGELKNEKVYVEGKLEKEKRFRIDGRVEYEMYYDGHKKIEKEAQFYASGELFRERTRIDGLMEGIEKDYYPSGKLKAERNYVSGKRSGKAQGFYENGQVQGDWRFVEGAPVSATIYHPNGQKNMVHEFSDGKLNGWTKEYDVKGKLVAERLYKDDKMVKRVRK